MADQPKKDPLEGFQIVDYNPDKEIVTIEIHPMILKNPRQVEALLKKCEEIIEHEKKGVSAVQVEPRKQN